MMGECLLVYTRDCLAVTWGAVDGRSMEPQAGWKRGEDGVGLQI